MNAVVYERFVASGLGAKNQANEAVVASRIICSVHCMQCSFHCI